VHLTGLAVHFRAPVVHLMAANTRSPQGGTASAWFYIIRNHSQNQLQQYQSIAIETDLNHLL